MGEDPDRIRAEIERTRTEMEGTVDALGYKADVKSRAKESLQETRDSAKESVMGTTRSVKEKLVGAKDSVADTAGGATPDREQVKRQARQAKGLAQENPVGLALGAIAVGFGQSTLSERFPTTWTYFQGALFIVVILFLPGGVSSLWPKLKSVVPSRANGAARVRTPTVPETAA